MALINDDEARQLALLSSIMTDEGAKKRVGEIQAATEENEKALNRLQVQQAINSQAVHEAQQRLDAAMCVEAQNRQFKDMLDQREKTMAEVGAALNEEKTKWETMRQHVDIENRMKTRSLEEWSERLTARQAELDAALNETHAIQATAIAQAALLKIKHQRLRDAIEFNEASDAGH